MHGMLATFTATPEIALSEMESKELAKGITAVTKEYGGVAVSPTQLAWFNLAQIVGIVYAPRIFAIRARKQAAASERRRAAPQQGPASMQEAPGNDGGISPRVIDLGL